MDNLFTEDLTFSGPASAAVADSSTPANTSSYQPVVTNPNTGDLSKSVDTAGDLAGIFASAAKIIGTVYPTGQKNPAAVQSPTTSQTVVNASTKNNLLIVGIGAVLVIGVVILAVKK